MRELNWKLAECRTRCDRLAEENNRLVMLLGYAEAALLAEYSAGRDGGKHARD